MSYQDPSYAKAIRIEIQRLRWELKELGGNNIKKIPKERLMMILDRSLPRNVDFDEAVASLSEIYKEEQ